MPPTDKSVSRREFTRRALGTACLLAYPPGAAAAPESPQPSQAPANVPKLSPESQSEADSRYQAIISQHGDRFSDVQKADLKRLCVFAQPPLDRIRAYAVGNGDLPALYLKPLVDRDKKSPDSGSRRPATNSTPHSPGATKSPAASPKP